MPESESYEKFGESYVPSVTRLFLAYFTLCMLWFVWYYLELMDAFKNIVPKDDGCIHMPGVPGAED